MPSAEIEVRRLGRVPYAEAHARMTAALEARIAGSGPDVLLLCEHDPVFTLGRRRDAASNVLAAGDVPVVSVERGGDVTFHGPGQVVGYPVLALPEHRRDLHAYLRGLEDVLIATLARLGVRGERDARNTGVWVGGRKVAAIGIACRRWVTWHGFAINVTTDLGWFDRINPCGMPSELVTRLSDHLRPAPSLDGVAAVAAEELGAWWSRWSAGA